MDNRSAVILETTDIALENHFQRKTGRSKFKQPAQAGNRVCSRLLTGMRTGGFALLLMKEMHDQLLSQTRIYRIWIGMKARCYNENSVPYPYYGAKGITVCEEWLPCGNGFMRFYEWSMQNGYNNALTIDRIDPSKGYCPSNCRWADKYTQNVHLDKPPGMSGYYGISKHKKP